MMEPNPDEFDFLVESLGDLQSPDDAVNYTTWDNEQLTREFHSLTQQLIERAEVTQQFTDEGRDLHSKRGAILIILRDRGLL